MLGMTWVCLQAGLWDLWKGHSVLLFMVLCLEVIVLLFFRCYRPSTEDFSRKFSLDYKHQGLIFQKPQWLKVNVWEFSLPAKRLWDSAGDSRSSASLLLAVVATGGKQCHQHIVTGKAASREEGICSTVQFPASLCADKSVLPEQQFLSWFSVENRGDNSLKRRKGGVGNAWESGCPFSSLKCVLQVKNRTWFSDLRLLQWVQGWSQITGIFCLYDLRKLSSSDVEKKKSIYLPEEIKKPPLALLSLYF